MLDNIPMELRERAQWVAVDLDKIPYNPTSGRRASVIDSSTWGTLEQAIAAGKAAVGFVLDKEDPYAIIDLDDPETKTNPDGSKRFSPDECLEILARQQKIMDHCNSYTELSQSGKGHHIIVKGTLKSGVNRDAVEMYSDSRHMICTGNVIKNVAITEHQEILDILYKEMSPPPTAVLVQEDGDDSDADIVDRALNAANGKKFLDLSNGQMEGYYTSQSEADFSLLSIIAFYTRDNEQVRRIFRMTALGKRDKAMRNDKYINFALEKIRAKQPPLIDISKLRLPEIKKASPPRPPEKINGVKKDLPKPPPKKNGVKKAIPKPPQKKKPGAMDYPPGLVGEIAEYIYSTAIRPVREVALTAALALTAGIAGRSYNISGTGLNQYIILIAKTGAGKEGAAAGIDQLISAVRPKIPMIDSFIGPGAFASGQALVRQLDEQPVFLSIMGEFGLTLQQLCDAKASGPQIMMRKVLLDLYGKSGWNKMLRASVYSDKDKNTNNIQAPNVTIFGESTPNTFYDGLDQSHIAEGLIPRFSIVEYKGDRPPKNKNAFHPPKEALVKKFAQMVTISLTTTNNNSCCQVEVDSNAAKLYDDFDILADGHINSSNGEVETQLWNRAHLKALKMGALLAVGVNPHNPIITQDLAEWAIRFVNADIKAITVKFNKGDIGTGDHKLEADVRRIVEQYWTLSDKQKRNYKVPKAVEGYRVIPFAYLKFRLKMLSSFKSDFRGANRAIESTLKAMVDAEELDLMPEIQVRKEFRIRQAIYSIGNSW